MTEVNSVDKKKRGRKKKDTNGSELYTNNDDIKTCQILPIDNRINVSNLGFFDLNQIALSLEKICAKYERITTMNIGSYDSHLQKEMLKATNILKKYNELHEKIIIEMQKKIDNVIW